MSDTPRLEVDPDRAAWPFRLWGVRHVRWLFCSWRVNVWARQWGKVGIGLGIAHPSDTAVLDAIWRGER